MSKKYQTVLSEDQERKLKELLIAYPKQTAYSLLQNGIVLLHQQMTKQKSKQSVDDQGNGGHRHCQHIVIDGSSKGRFMSSKQDDKDVSQTNVATGNRSEDTSFEDEWNSALDSAFDLLSDVVKEETRESASEQKRTTKRNQIKRQIRRDTINR